MKKSVTKFIASILAVSAFATLVSCGKKTNTNSLTNALSDGTLTVGYTIYAPMNYYEDKTNEFVGFDTELAKAFTKDLGVNIKFVEIEWDNKFIDLEANTIDCIWNGMTITEKVQKKTACSSMYLENKQVVVCKKTDAELFTTIESIKTATNVAFESGSAGEAAANEAAVEKSKQVAATAQKDTLLEVKSGTSQIAIIDETMAKVLTGEGTSYSDLTYVDVGFESEEFGVAFRKEDAFLAQIFDLFILNYKASGAFDTLQTKYFA